MYNALGSMSDGFPVQIQVKFWCKLVGSGPHYYCKALLVLCFPFVIGPFADAFCPFWDLKQSQISNHKEQVGNISHLLKAICQ
jgi:hypothetical protein